MLAKFVSAGSARLYSRSQDLTAISASTTLLLYPKNHRLREHSSSEGTSPALRLEMSAITSISLLRSSNESAD